MPYPGVNISVQNGNLLRALEVSDGIGAIVATAALAANTGKIQAVYSLPDAESKGYTEADEPFLHKLLSEFYAELGGNMQLYVMGVAETETMADLVASTNADGLLKLMTASAGDANLIAIARKPSAAYDAGEGFLDVDVEKTVLASLPLCQAMQAKNTPLRLFIEGRVANEDAAINTFKPNEANNGFASVVLGGTSADGSGAVSLALARACKYEAHVKLGSGQNGALTIPQVYVGTKAMEERPDMETLHDQGFLTFMRRPGTAGYYFGVDNMCENADFSILVHGRVIDKAQRVAAAAYQPYVEDYIRINPDGTLNAGDAKHLEDILDTAVRANMGGQISDVKVVIDTNQDVINTRTFKVSVSVLPLGYLTWINVTLGLTAQTTN